MSGARLNTTCETTVSIPDDSDEQQEVIEVQILPQVSSADRTGRVDRRGRAGENSSQKSAILQAMRENFEKDLAAGDSEQ